MIRMLMSWRKKLSTAGSRSRRVNPEPTAILIAAIGPRTPRAGASRSEKLRLHGTATLNLCRIVIVGTGTTKLAFQRMFEVSELRRIALGEGPSHGDMCRDQTYSAASEKWSGSAQRLMESQEQKRAAAVQGDKAHFRACEMCGVLRKGGL